VNQRKASSQKRVEGMDARHSRSCASRSSSDCNCKPSYQAHVWSKREGKRIRKTFSNISEAKSWRRDALAALDKGTMKAPTRETIRQKADALIAGMKDGSIRDKSGRVYKPSTIRTYEIALNRIVAFFGETARFSDLQRADWQRLADKMLAEKCDPSTIRNTLMPARVMYRRALQDGEVALNPCASLRLPAVTGRRDRIDSPEEASEHIAALVEADRALWATAFYAGLRRGELQALRVEDVDIAGGRIRVERAWDRSEGLIETKNRERRVVPIPAVLREHLAAHLLRTGRREGFIFGDTPERPFNYDRTFRRAQSAWKTAGLERICLHECRHTYVTLMFESGLSLERIGDYVGHSSTYVTARYRHLLEGHEDAAAKALDEYLERAASS
jgi:integrase